MVILMVGTGVKQKYFERIPKDGHTLKSNQGVILTTIIDPMHVFSLPQL